MKLSVITAVSATVQTLTQCLKSGAFVLLALLSLGAEPLHARGFLTMDDVPDVNFGTWVDSGSFSSEMNLCISSANASSWLPWRAARILDYRARVTSLQDAGNLFLYLNGDASAKGNQRIAIRFTHSDLRGPGGTESLEANRFDRIANTGQFLYCLFGGDNARLGVELASQDLGAAQSGDYWGSFRFEADNRFGNDSDIFSVRVTVQGRSEVRISGLDDLDLGRYGGGNFGDITVSERFCVYSNNGDYRLSISSPNQDGAGNFFLYSDATGDSIPMSVHFADSGTGSGNTRITTNSAVGVGDSSRVDCGGSNNATVTLSLREDDIRASSSGFYSDSLLLLVEPE